MARDPRYKIIENALLTVRKQNGLTQIELAERLGKPQSYVSKYESGERRLDLIEFVDVCAALEVVPEQIFRKLKAKE